MDLRGRLPLFIRNFVSERKFRVRMVTSLSDFNDQEMGVRQGSIFSVTLFIVKINSITSCIRNGVDKSLFVDDFGVSYRSKHMHAIERQLKLHLNRIGNWADNNGFKFSQSKIVCVHFCPRGLHPDPYLVLGIVLTELDLILTSSQSLNFLKLLHGHIQLLWSTSLFCMLRRIKRILRST